MEHIKEFHAINVRHLYLKFNDKEDMQKYILILLLNSNLKKITIDSINGKQLL